MGKKERERHRERNSLNCLRDAHCIIEQWTHPFSLFGCEVTAQFFFNEVIAHAPVDSCKKWAQTNRNTEAFEWSIPAWIKDEKKSVRCRAPSEHRIAALNVDNNVNKNNHIPLDEVRSTTATYIVHEKKLDSTRLQLLCSCTKYVQPINTWNRSQCSRCRQVLVQTLRTSTNMLR